MNGEMSGMDLNKYDYKKENIFMKKHYLTVLCISAFVLMLMGCGKRSGNISTNEEINGNLVNESLITKQGEWLYYSSNDGMYKSKTDGTEIM